MTKVFWVMMLMLMMGSPIVTFAMVDPVTPISAQPASGGVGWELVWTDEFNGTSLDMSKWQKLVSTKSRAARPTQGIDDWWWKSENAFVDGAGNLILEVVKHDYNTMYCGSVNTNNLYEPTYGYFEARIEVADTSKGTHTAFWFQGDNMSNVDGTGNDGAEIDVFESAWVGDYTKSVVHIDGYGGDHQANTKQWNAPGIHSGYHTYGIEWTHDYMRIYYDGVLKTEYTGSQWIPRVSEYIWLSDGASFGDGDFQSQPVGYLTEARVDYVRVWQDMSQPVILVNDDDAGITYEGAWSTWQGNPGYQEDEHFSETTDSTATFTFTGTKAWYYGFKRNDLGHVEIYLDGQLMDTVDCYSSTANYFIPLYQSPDVPFGEHTLMVRVTGTKNASSSGTEVIVDAFGYSQTVLGDLNLDGKVDLRDMAKLSQGWQTIYDINTLLYIANDWLYGTSL